MENHTVPRPPNGRNNRLLETLLEAVLDELRAVRAELRAHRRQADEAIGAYLNAKFPFGRPRDRWGRRRG